MRERDCGTQSPQIDRIFFIIYRILIRLVNDRGFHGMLLHIKKRLIIHRENTILAASLNRHIGNGKTVIHGQA